MPSLSRIGKKVLIGGFGGSSSGNVYVAPVYPSNEIYFFSGTFRTRVTVAPNPSSSSQGGFSISSADGSSSPNYILTINNFINIPISSINTSNDGNEYFTGLVSIVRSHVIIKNFILPRGHTIFAHGPYMCTVYKEFY